jgi:AcrR family transcriptional regulator
VPHEPAPRADATRNRAAILRAAVTELAIEPAASLAQIASRAGLTRATVYRHFPNREALRAALHDDVLQRAHDVIDEALLTEGTARDALCRAVHALVSLGFEFRVLLAEGADVDQAFRTRRDLVLAPLDAVLARARTTGELSASVDPVWARATLIALLVAAVRVTDTGTIAPEKAAELVCRTIFDGLGDRTKPRKKSN